MHDPRSLTHDLLTTFPQKVRSKPTQRGVAFFRPQQPDPVAIDGLRRLVRQYYPAVVTDRQIDVTHDMRARARILMDRAMFINLDNIRPPPNNALLNSQWGGDRYYDRTLALILRFLLDAADSSFMERYTGHKIRKVVSLIRQWLRARGFNIESTPSQ